jgi:hypothetical protein
VLPGLPFLSGGSLWGELQSEFTVAKPAVGGWTRAMRMTVQVPGRGGITPVDFVLEPAEASRPGALTLTILPQGSGSQQRQRVWARVDGDRWRMQPFAMPLFGTSVADASEVVGAVTQVDPSNQDITRVEGTLRIRGPGIDMKNIAFTLVPR